MRFIEQETIVFNFFRLVSEDMFLAAEVINSGRIIFIVVTNSLIKTNLLDLSLILFSN